MRPRPTLFVMLLAASACSQSGQSPAPSASESTAPAALSVVPVEVVLATDKAVIDGVLLAKTKPDFDDGEHKGWWLRSLVPGYDPSQPVEVEDADGRTTPLEGTGPEAGKREVLLALSKQGELKVTLASASDPFPAFHGRGGNRGRGPDSIRVQRVRRILVTHPTVSPK
jgi:hypothetical protein